MLKNKISVLIVDDEIDICEMVAEILKDEGYNAITANSYEIAVEILKNQNITLLITDISVSYTHLTLPTILLV